MTKRDNNVWRELPARSDGFVPAVPRRWTFTGTSRGQRCRFPVELIAAHPSVADTYTCRAVFAHNAPFTPDWVNLRDLESN